MSVSIGGEQADLLGIAPAAIAALTADGSGLIDPGALADAVTPPAPLPPLPAGATTLTVDVGAASRGSPVRLDRGRLGSARESSAGAGTAAGWAGHRHFPSTAARRGSSRQ